MIRRILAILCLSVLLAPFLVAVPMMGCTRAVPAAPFTAHRDAGLRRTSGVRDVREVWTLDWYSVPGYLRATRPGEVRYYRLKGQMLEDVPAGEPIP